jgi:hypothetical protein
MSFESHEELRLVDSPVRTTRVIFDLDQGFIIDEEGDLFGTREQE